MKIPTDLTYACVGGPPEDWLNIVVCNADGEEISDVIEVNTEEGWLRRYARDEQGKCIIDDDEWVIELMQGQFTILRRLLVQSNTLDETP